MKIVIDYPPNYDEIAKTFGIRGQTGIVFTYGDNLYNPENGFIPDHLMTHEETHQIQQNKMGADKWWSQYLVDPEFRLQQELEAYQAQYEVLVTDYDRAYRREALNQISKDLASNIYGHIVTKEEAKILIKGEN
jgi:hypothetical protein